MTMTGHTSTVELLRSLFTHVRSDHAGGRHPQTQLAAIAGADRPGWYGWQVVVNIDGGYTHRADAEDVAVNYWAPLLGELLDRLNDANEPTVPTGISRHLGHLHTLARKISDDATVAYSSPDADTSDTASAHVVVHTDELIDELYLLAQHLHKLGLLTEASSA